MSAAANSTLTSGGSRKVMVFLKTKPHYNAPGNMPNPDEMMPAPVKTTNSMIKVSFGKTMPASSRRTQRTGTDHE